VDKKNQQSKAKFGTLTATSDANQDYSSSSSASNATMGSNTSSSTMGSSAANTTTAANASSLSEYGTMTAKFDANNDYGGKSGNQSKSSNTGQQQQAGTKKTLTSDKNIGH
jgi:hypothetical protein